MRLFVPYTLMTWLSFWIWFSSKSPCAEEEEKRRRRVSELI